MELGAVRQVLVDIGHGRLQRRRAALRHAAAARRLKGIHHPPAGVQQVLGLVQHALHGGLRIVGGQVRRQQIALLHDAVDDHLQIVFTDGALQRLHRRVGDLGGHGVLLGVFVVGDGRLSRPVRQHPKHIPTELPVNDHRRVVVPGLHAALGLLLGVHDDPVDGRGLPQVGHHVVALVLVGAVLIGIALVQRRHRDGYPPGVAVGVPVGVDIQPGVQAGQQGDGDHHHAGEKALAQRPYIGFEYRPDITHTASLRAARRAVYKAVVNNSVSVCIIQKAAMICPHKTRFLPKKQKRDGSRRLFRSTLFLYPPPRCGSRYSPSACTRWHTAPRTPQSSPPLCRSAAPGCPG